jgi:hypothetical protein
MTSDALRSDQCSPGKATVTFGSLATPEGGSSYSGHLCSVLSGRSRRAYLLLPPNESGHDRARAPRRRALPLPLPPLPPPRFGAGRLLAGEGGLVVLVRGLAALVALDAGRLLELLEAGVPLLVGELAGLLLEALASELAELAGEALAELAEAVLGELGGAGRLLGLVDLLLEVVALLLGGDLGRLLVLDLLLEVRDLGGGLLEVDTFFSRSSTRAASRFSSSYSLRLISMVSMREVLLCGLASR